MEMTADDFFAVFKDGNVSINGFLKRLHNFALHPGFGCFSFVNAAEFFVDGGAAELQRSPA